MATTRRRRPQTASHTDESRASKPAGRLEPFRASCRWTSADMQGNNCASGFREKHMETGRGARITTAQ